MQSALTEAEPPIRVKFSSSFEIMAEQIENDDAAVPSQDPMRRFDGPFRLDRVMQRLAQQDQIDGFLRDRRIFQIAQPIFEVLEAMVFCELGSEIDHLRSEER